MRLGRMGSALAFAAAMLAVDNAAARVCQGNAEISGPYGFTATRFGLTGSPATFTGTFTGIAVTPPGTITPSTGIPGLPAAAFNGPGGLVTGAATGEPFSRTGSVFADNGGLFLNAITGPRTGIGSYTVNADCTVTMSINNNFAFGTDDDGDDGGTGGGNNPLTGPSTVMFTGVLVDQGEEVHLLQTGAAGGTSLTLQRTATFRSCGENDLAGDFGMVGSGNIISAGPVFTPFSIAGRLVADGNGTFATDAFSLMAPQQRRLTGTYNVNPDCTGTAQLVIGGTTTRTLDFVLVRERGRGRAFPGPGVQMFFTVRGTGITGSGVAKPQ